MKKVDYYIGETRIAQVKDFNAIVDVHGIDKAYKMMNDDNWTPRSKGWVIFQSPKLGDTQDFAKWFANETEARLARKSMA